MKKKVSLEAIDDILGGAPQEENVETTTKREKKSCAGRPKEDDYESTTFRVRKEYVQKLRIIANKEGRLQKDILDFALKYVIDRYEKKHGVIDVSKTYQSKGIEDIF